MLRWRACCISIRKINVCFCYNSNQFFTAISLPSICWMRPSCLPDLSTKKSVGKNANVVVVVRPLLRSKLSGISNICQFWLLCLLDHLVDVVGPLWCCPSSTIILLCSSWKTVRDLHNWQSRDWKNFPISQNRPVSTETEIRQSFFTKLINTLLPLVCAVCAPMGSSWVTAMSAAHRFSISHITFCS